MEKIPVNNFIRAKEVRVIGQAGEQLGVMNIFQAIDLARAQGMDLIQVTEKVVPPVCKIGNYGKYLYSLQKKEKKIKVKTKVTKLKEIQLGFNIAQGDIDTKAKQAESFLKEGDKVKVTMVLKGREKAMGDIAYKKIVSFLETTDKLISVKVEREIKREPKGFSAIISKE